MIGTALFDATGQYRYTLTRAWLLGHGIVAFIGLNPSRADATEDDATIRRCVGFAQALGYRGLVMLNLFAYRATDPAQLRRVADPVGPDNDQHILAGVTTANRIIAAWGSGGA